MATPIYAAAPSGGFTILNTLIVALLGAGGATFIWTVAKSVIAFKNSAEGREDKAIARLERFESDCREQLAHERSWGAYWQRRSAMMERALLMAGVEVPPCPDPPRDPQDGPTTVQF